MAKQARSENTRLDLVRSAAELFDRNGFAGTTLADGVDPGHALTLVLATSAGLEMLWWAGIRQGSMVDGLTCLWSMMLPGIAAPGVNPALRATGSPRTVE
jgi:hypothetical protein